MSLFYFVVEGKIGKVLEDILMGVLYIGLMNWFLYCRDIESMMFI